MIISCLTLFPEYFDSSLSSSILGKAIDKKLLKVNCYNIRDFAKDKHKITDDRPFGGGAGMVMKIDPIAKALDHLKKLHPDLHSKVVVTSAKGTIYTQKTAQNYATYQHLIILCGHYEGIDERVIEHLVDEEVRIGDYVLTGGEPAASVIIDSVARLLPEVLGNPESNKDESHSEPGQGSYPVYTRPEEYNGWSVPSVLLSGDHQKIAEWRKSHQKKLD